jgi:PAS domain S-box-containing protein
MAEPEYITDHTATAFRRTSINPYTVRFTDALEDDFQEALQETLLRGHRSGLVVLALVCAIYAVLDWLIMPELRYLVWSIRFLGVLPFAIMAIMATYWKPAQSYSGYLSIGCLLLSSAATVLMMIFAPEAVSGAYFAGLLIHIMLCYGIFRLEFVTSLICGGVMLVAYNAGALMYGAFSQEALIIHNFLFITGIGLGLVQTYTRNQMVRELYLRGLSMEPTSVERAKAEHAQERPTAPPIKMVPLYPEPAEPAAPEPVEVPPAAQEPTTPPAQSSSLREQGLEQELRDAGRLFNLFMERISDVVWFADREGRFLYVSPSSERIWGHSAKELTKKTFKDLLTRESYEYLMAEIKAANKVSGGSVRPLDLEIVTKNRLIKTGETVALAFQDHETYGSGIIGVTRDMTYRRHTEQELKKFNEELEGLIKKRSTELEDTLKRLKSMEEAMNVPEDPERLEELPVIRYLRGNFDALHRQIVQLQDATHQLQGLYRIKSMRKEDLEQYLQWVSAFSEQAGTTLQDSIHHLYQGSAKSLDPKKPKNPNAFNFRLGDYIEQVLIGFSSRFKQTGHMVDIDCPDAIMVYGDPALYSQMLSALVGYSLNVGLAGVKGGEIDIRVLEQQDNWCIRYKDNGKGLTAEALDQLFEKPYQASGEGSGLQRARDIVRDELGGEFRLNSQGGALAFEIVIPKHQDLTA